MPIARVLAVSRGLEAFAIAVWLVQLPITFAIIRLDYQLRWYVVTDRAARLREGVLTLTEMTFTLVNVQDIRIQQGPLQRLLGLADVELRTAGGSDAGGEGGHGSAPSRNLHLARFRGVDNADAIRDLVLERMKRARDAGLGDPDDAEAETSGAHGARDAARELMAESAALRLAGVAAGVGWRPIDHARRAKAGLPTEELAENFRSRDPEPGATEVRVPPRCPRSLARARLGDRPLGLARGPASRRRCSSAGSRRPSRGTPWTAIRWPLATGAAH